MFQGASAFNQPIGNWNTSAAETPCICLFNRSATGIHRRLQIWIYVQKCRSFNQAISNWNTDKVISFIQIFNDATSFQPIKTSVHGWRVGMCPRRYQQHFSMISITIPSHPIPTGPTTGRKDWARPPLPTPTFNRANGSPIISLHHLRAHQGLELTGVNMANAFMNRLASAFVTNHVLPSPSTNHWSASAVQRHVQQAASFNQPIGDWNTSITTMDSMFRPPPSITTRA